MTSAVLQQLQGLLGDGVIGPIDWQFANHISRYDSCREVVLAAAMVSQALGQQNSCVDLRQRCDHGEMIPGAGIESPPLDQWLELLHNSEVVGSVGDHAPLLLDGDLLYLSRYLRCESEIAEELLARAEVIGVDERWLRQRLDHYFGDAEPPDWQKLAAACALGRRFALIAGGPGTGKTTTVVKILALLLEQRQHQGDAGHYRIRMAAPTGKAAARLAQSIASALQDQASIEPEIAAVLPTEVATIHRLLRPLPNSTRFRHHAGNPLACEVLLVDEVSMIDIGLMAQLLAALKPGTRIILLGDRDQLPSVGVGQLLHDLCASLGAAGSKHCLAYSPAQQGFLERSCGFSLDAWVRPGQQPGLGDCIALLQRSYRFGADSGIGELAQIVNGGDEAGARELLLRVDAGGYSDISALVPSATSSQWLAQLAAPYVGLVRQCLDPELSAQQKLQTLEDYRILCALREGAGGVQRVNQYIESYLAQQGLASEMQPYYPGRPIMVTENNYSLQLYNGDNGLILRDDSGQLYACFEGVDGMPRRVAISRLPRHECSYAISVHKSQGSEYRHVALVLPPSRPRELAPLVTRELVYTAVTRAREQLTLAVTAELLCVAIRRRVHRDTGLAARLHRVQQGS